MSTTKKRPLYNQALLALQTAHDACMKNPDRDVLGMSHGPFSGVNEALEIVDGLEQALDRALTQLEGLANDCHPIDDIISRAKTAAAKASVKFPQPNYVALKIAEEAGEVVRGCVHYAEKRMEWEEVEDEIVQLIAMLIRLITEGDQINGVTPPRAILAAKED